MTNARFPFGQPVQEVVQAERSPKPVFVLGVYASAVHARWVSTNNKTLVTALAVASEPYIFWRGENAESIKREIDIPREIVMEKYGLPQPSVPPVPTQLTDEIRRNAILDELQQSDAGTLVLLGDQPVRWFLSYFDSRWQRLSDFMRGSHDYYGKIHCANIAGKPIDILPLAHPRQIAKLGHASPIWYRHHQDWLKKRKITS